MIKLQKGANICHTWHNGLKRFSFVFCHLVSSEVSHVQKLQSAGFITEREFHVWHVPDPDGIFMFH